MKINLGRTVVAASCAAGMLVASAGMASAEAPDTADIVTPVGGTHWAEVNVHVNLPKPADFSDVEGDSVAFDGARLTCHGTWDMDVQGSVTRADPQVASFSFVTNDPGASGACTVSPSAPFRYVFTTYDSGSYSVDCSHVAGVTCVDDAGKIAAVTGGPSPTSFTYDYHQLWATYA